MLRMDTASRVNS